MNIVSDPDAPLRPGDWRDYRAAWIAARQVVFAARAVVAAWPSDMEFGKPGTSIGKLRDRLVAYDQRNHEPKASGAGDGEGA